MKAEIKIFTFKKELTEDQKQILRRYLNVLREHDLCVELVIRKKQKIKKIIEIKRIAG